MRQQPRRHLVVVVEVEVVEVVEVVVVVAMVRSGSNLLVTISTDVLYKMDQVHLYVDDEPPTNSAPGQFPYKHEVADPADYFTSFTFTVDVSVFAGKTIYVAAHAHVFQQV